MGRRQKKRQEKNKKNRGVRDLMVALLLVCSIIYLIACTMPEKGRIVNHTYVNHVDVSGLSQEEAAQRIQEDFEKSYAHQSLTAEAAGQKFSILINDSLKINADAAAKEACEYAHGLFLTRGFELLRAALFHKRISRNAHIADDEALKKAVIDSGIMGVNTTTQTQYEIIGDELVFQKGAVGESPDQKLLIEKLKEAVKKEDYVSVIPCPMLKGTVLPTDMQEVYQNVHSVKKDATLDPKNHYKIVKAVTGIDFDPASATQAFQAVPDGGQVVIPLKVDKPDVTTKDLKENLFADTLANSVTKIEGTEARAQNIKLAAKQINGKILLAGESFSFNKVVGERTAEKGYQSASAFGDGRTKRELGGGIGQVSSTLYKSAMLSNLKIEERHNHSIVSDYIDMGMDATVSWNDTDFRFANDSKYPIKISAKCEDGELRVKLIGTKKGDQEVKITSKILRVIDFGTVYQDAPTLPVGESAVISEGSDGYEVQTYRKIYDKTGKELSSVKEARSEYQPVNRVVANGTKEPEASTESTQTTGSAGSAGGTDTAGGADAAGNTPNANSSGE